MYFDLNIPVSQWLPTVAPSKTGKEKQITHITFAASQLAAIEARIDLLVHLGYTVLAFNHTIRKRLETKAHVNPLDTLLPLLRARDGIIYLKRLTLVLDEDSEKGSGLTLANVSVLNTYDLLSVVPTTQSTFSAACLTYSVPSPLTCHIISLPLTLPRLPYHLKHTLIRTAIKNGAVFEISYNGALGGGNDATLADADAAESGANAKRNWWAAARDLVRVAKGNNLLISGGVVDHGDLRAPRDVGNLFTLLGLAQDVAHSSSTKVPKSLVVRAQTRKTYRAVLSEPRVVIPEGYNPAEFGAHGGDTTDPAAFSGPAPTPNAVQPEVENTSAPANAKKRSHEDIETIQTTASHNAGNQEDLSKKKKRKKNKQGGNGNA